MQSDARLSYVRIVHRIAGTVAGVVAAFALTSLLQEPWVIALAALVLAPLIPHHLQHRYWLHTALIAVVILLAYHLATSDPRILRGLMTERLQDVLLGAGLALIGTLLAFPRWAAATDPRPGVSRGRAPSETTKKASESFPVGAQIYFDREPGKTRLATSEPPPKTGEFVAR